ncbi:hypothetical protein HPG69_008071 [Diceros bicornis minor]|uniref:CFA20 domain-containing protein n=1 Tax=Diceros bicornis minor TaxID=77932 RepID=A0A7J7F414_DICBM|nr:hypothetical protein HPG69_008071 [Diceros bicornis minor]
MELWYRLVQARRLWKSCVEITDLGNIKRRLYLSTVHKELSSTPLHAKIPLFMIKRKIWCNLCIDLVAFTSEIFKGAVFQSLDGIIVSANCKLRKIFTLKYKPQDTADKDAGYGVPLPTDEPTDIIPRSCQLTTDVPQVTQLLNMTKLRQTDIKFGDHPLGSAESDKKRLTSLSPSTIANRLLISLDLGLWVKEMPQFLVPVSDDNSKGVYHIKFRYNFNSHWISTAKQEIPLRNSRKNICDQFINRGTGSVRNSKNQDVCHIAFGSKVLGPPPLSGRRNNMRISSETIRSVGSRNNRSCQQSVVEKCANSAEMSTLLISESEEQGYKENMRQIKQTVPIHANLHAMHPHPPQEPSTDKNNNRRRLRLKSTSREKTETPSGSSSGNNRNEGKATTALTTVSQQRAETLNPSSPARQSPDQADEWIFPENGHHIAHLASNRQSLLLDDNSCHTSHLWLEASKEREHDQQAEETQIVAKDIFTFSSRPRSAPHGKTQNVSPEGGSFILDLKEDTSVTRSDTQLEDDFYGGDSSEEGNHSVQGPSGPTTSSSRLTQLTLESVLGKAARRTSKGYPRAASKEAGASESQISLEKQIDRNDFQTSLVPTPCLSPTGRRSESSRKTPDPIIKAKDLPAHQVPASVNKTSLKEILGEKLKPIPEVSK